MVDRADGAVRVLDTRTGDIRPTVVLFSGTAPIAAVVDERANHTFVAGYISGSGGTVSVIDTAGAWFLRIMSLGRIHGARRLTRQERVPSLSAPPAMRSSSSTRATAASRAHSRSEVLMARLLSTPGLDISS